MKCADPLVVVYDKGAVSPGEIAVGLADVAPVLFLLGNSEHTAGMRTITAELGEVAALTGNLEVDAATVRRVRPAGIVTFSESMLRTTAELAELVNLPFHSVSTARLLTDKAQQRQQLRDAGVDRTRSATVTSLEEIPAALDLVGLPAVVKPACGEGSRSTMPLTDRGQSLRLLPELFREVVPGGVVRGDPVLVLEELLGGAPRLPYGDYVSVESAFTPSGVTHLAVTGKFPTVWPFREVGNFWPAGLSAEEEREVLALAGQSLKALEVTSGLAHTEIKITADGPRVIEVNGRLGGHINHLAGFACGVDLVRLAGLLALGEPPAVRPLAPDRVSFQHRRLAPSRPCSLEAIHGAADVRKLPGVLGHRAYARPGQRWPESVMTRPMDLLWGQVDDHATMFRLVDQAVSLLAYDLRFDSEVRRVPAAALADRG